jgi:hypothetical protein
VTQVSTLPSGIYRQHQRNRADERLASLALRALGIWRDSWIQAARWAGGLGRFPGLGRAADAESGPGKVVTFRWTECRLGSPVVVEFSGGPAVQGCGVVEVVIGPFG